MKFLKLFLSIVIISITNNLYAQVLELGGNFSSSNEEFYKNTFGGNIGYQHHFKKQYILLQLKSSFKNNSYSQVAGGFVHGPDYYNSLKSDGKLTINTLKLGVAQKLVNTETACLSLGVLASLNYVKFDDKTILIVSDTSMPVMIYRDEKAETYNNKFGYGAFIDMELKKILFHQISVFSRFEVDDVTLVPVKDIQRGIYFQKTGYTTFECMLGLRYNLKKE